MLFAGQPDADGSSKNHLQGGPVLTLKAYDRARCDDLSYIVGEGERLGSHRTPQRELQPVFTFVETNSSFQFFFFFFLSFGTLLHLYRTLAPRKRAKKRFVDLSI